MNARQKASEATAALVAGFERRLADGTLKPGDKLPPERELVATYGLARNTVRRCLDDLERAGRVVRHVGRGTFIAASATPEDRLAQLSNHLLVVASPAEVMEVRLMIEPQAVRLAVPRANSADLRALQEGVEKAEAAASVAEFERWDGFLHRTLVAAAHNRLLVEIYQAVDSVRQQAEWGQLKERSLTPERRRVYESQHRRLLEALTDRDLARAVDEISQHLTQVNANLLGG